MPDSNARASCEIAFAFRASRIRCPSTASDDRFFNRCHGRHATDFTATGYSHHFGLRGCWDFRSIRIRMKARLSAIRSLCCVSLILSAAVCGQAKEAALSAYCLSVNLGHGTASLGGALLDAYFTTYDGSAGVPLYDELGNLIIVSSELSPNPAVLGNYRTDYVLFANGSVDSTGTAVANFPMTDADGNGVADFLQVARNGSVAFSGTVTREIPSTSPAQTMTGQITRAAGSFAGSYVANIQDPRVGVVIYRGTSYLLNAQGSMAYDRNNNTAVITATLSNEDGTTTTYSGSTAFVVVNANTVSFPAINYSGSNARVIQAKAFTLTRSGKRYLGNVEFQDGGLSTSWRDYINWRLEFTDNNDTDADGIPDLSDTVAVAPTVTAHPQSTTVLVGQAVQFAVTATGTAPFTYQWQRNTQNIPTATGATYAITSAQLANAGDYRVIVSNAAGSATSQVATLTVNPAAVAPTITGHPQSATVTVGQAVQFAVTATGTAPFTYQWQRNSQNIPLATGSTYSLSNVQLTDAADFRVLVRNSAGNATSQVAKLTVNAVTVAPAITSQPQSLTVTEGQPAQFSVTATGTPPLSYQWRKGDSDLPGATAATLAFANTHSTNAGNYVVVVRNGAGQATSLVATLTVNPTVPATLRIVRLRGLSTSDLDVDVSVTAGRNYVLEASGDFKTWATAQSFSAAQSATTVRTPNAAVTTRFFRVREATGGPAAPVIVQHPQDQTVVIGKLASFTVKVEGTGPFTYQWQRGVTPVPNKISPTLFFSSAKLSDAGTYRVVVTGPGGSTTSDEAVLTVEAP